jgi:NAD(P)-dependent dehydrogenase (short-subunit alcohol dehydrogenase family)
MKGKTVLITGATSGIGLQTALALTKMGARMVFTTRNLARGEEVGGFLREHAGNDAVFPMFCRLDSLASVGEFCAKFLEQHARLDVLINNAGILQTRRKLSEDGIELTFAVNHLAPFLLTRLLLGRIIECAPARIINVSSDTHFDAQMDLNDLECKNGFPWMAAYRQSKLANVLFTYSLAEQLNGTGITVNCLHPGFVHTSIFRNLNPLVRLFLPFRAISPAKGAETSVFLASDPALEKTTGQYFCKKKPMRSAPASYDRELATRLWEISMQYIEKEREAFLETSHL